jgi:hypothetical protein
MAPVPNGGGLLVPHCSLQWQARWSHAFLPGRLVRAAPTLYIDGEEIVHVADDRERREQLVRALVEGEESGLSRRSVRDIIADAKSAAGVVTPVPAANRPH